MLQCLLLYIHHMIDHLKKNLGWYVMIPSLYLAFAGESEIWLVIFVVLLKMPPFDLVGRYEEWLSRKMKVKERGEKLKANIAKRPKWQRWLYVLFVILLIILWVLYVPECELC
jgi:magnesium-transporting ATPase (P-type)